MTKFPQGVCLWLAVGAMSVGCTSMKKTDTARTGKEQLLISNAVDQTLSKIDFQPFAGRRVFVEEKYLEAVDKGYIASSIRHRVARAGGVIASKPEEAEIVLEVRSGGVGTDNSDAFLGVPEIVLPGMLTLPEVRFVSRSAQTAVAKIGMAAYDARTKQLLGEGGVPLSQSTDHNWYVLGVGPYQNGTLKYEVDKANVVTRTATYQELPSQVAFREPPDSQEPRRVRLTDGQREPLPVEGAPVEGTPVPPQ